MLLHSLRVGLKVLARRPFFTFVSLFGIALTQAVLFDSNMTRVGAI